MDRRRFLAASAALAAAPFAHVAEAAGIDKAAMRGSIDAGEFGIRAAAFDDQSKTFQKLLDTAADRNMPIHLPAGLYVVSNLTLPKRLRLSGVPGASRIVYGGDGHLMIAEDADHIEISGIVVDGANRWLDESALGLLDARRVRHFVIDNCEFLGSVKNALALERVSGRIERSTITGAADAAIYSVEAGRLAITGNSVADCGNGGILVHRWQAAEDGTIISGNRVERILARNGGTGQFGNGINVFRANGVQVAGNSIADCAFSAIRANSASNIQICGNSCARSGETAIYAEFAFEGAVVTGNIVDQAANGISIVNFNEGGRMAVCSANLVRNLNIAGPYPADAPGFGVGITVEADVALTGNVVEGAPLYGMQLGWGAFLRNVAATGNVIRKSGTGIAVSVVEGAGAAVICDNVIEGSSNGAIVGHRWAKPITADLAKIGNAGYRHLTVERNHAA